MDCLVPKGYVALDGVSLTLTDINDDQKTFSVMLIAHTQDKVILTDKREGDLVNVEMDMVAKSVAKIVHRSYQQKARHSPFAAALTWKLRRRLTLTRGTCAGHASRRQMTGCRQ